MPEGDSLRRAAERLKALEGEVVRAESVHPRARTLRVAERIDRLRLERVEAVGKNLLLTFEGGLVLRSHLRMKGRWQVKRVDEELHGSPWLVLAGKDAQAVLWHGPVLELQPRGLGRLGPDVMEDPPDVQKMVRRLRGADQSREVGDALLDQRLVAGIGNLWKAEALHDARLSPWLRLERMADEELARVLESAARLMRGSRVPRAVYRRAGRGCRRCGEVIRSAPQGPEARTAYWCPSCQSLERRSSPPARPSHSRTGPSRSR